MAVLVYVGSAGIFQFARRGANIYFNEYTPYIFYYIYMTGYKVSFRLRLSLSVPVCSECLCTKAGKLGNCESGPPPQFGYKQA